MQTFLPYPSYYESMKCLDNRRLGNQVYRECKTLINGGWPNHPAAKMWRGHHYQLALYALAGIQILHERGRDYPQHKKFFNEKLELNFLEHFRPSWLGDDKLHSSHRSALLRKDPEWYGRFGWTDDPNQPYYWPV